MPSITATTRRSIVRLAAGALLYWLVLLAFSFTQQTYLVPLLVFFCLPLAALALVVLWRSGHLHVDDLAFRDDLTSLGNRRAFRRRAEAMLRRAGSGTLAMILLDVDDLKTVNDDCGHLAGDELLIGVSEYLLSISPSPNSLFRIGGDEFALLIDRTRGESVTAVIERLKPYRQHFRTCGHEHAVNVSFGFGSAGPNETFDGLFRRAAARLRDLKRQLYSNGDRQDRRRQSIDTTKVVAAALAAEPEPEISSNVTSLEERRRQRREQRA